MVQLQISLTGDLGRHGQSEAYKQYSKYYATFSKNPLHVHYDNVSCYQRDSANCEDLAEEYSGKGIRKNGHSSSWWLLEASSFKSF